MFRSTRARLTTLLVSVVLLLYAIAAGTIYLLMVRLTVTNENALLLSSARPLVPAVRASLNEGRFPQEFVDLRLLEKLFPRLTTIVLRDAAGHVLADTNSTIGGQLPYNAKSGLQTISLPKSHLVLRLYSVPLKNAYGQTIGGLQLALNVSKDLATLTQLRRIVLSVGLAGGVAAVIGGLYASSRALRPIVQSWQEQQRFVADASHELRTPLTVMAANLDVVFSHSGETILDNLEWLANTREEISRLSRLTNHLLTLARADSNQVVLDVQPVDLFDIVRDVHESFAILAEAKGIQFPAPTVFPAKSGSGDRTVALESAQANGAFGASDDANTVLVMETDAVRESRPFACYGDAARLRQLIVILVDNAIKYTPENGRVSLTLTQRRNVLKVAVSDTGIGIPSSQQKLIFGRFYRSDEARTLSSAGAGLGLSIARFIVTMHRGKISVTSTPGKGSTFTVFLRAYALRREANGPNQPSASSDSTLPL